MLSYKCKDQHCQDLENNLEHRIILCFCHRHIAVPEHARKEQRLLSALCSNDNRKWIQDTVSHTVTSGPCLGAFWGWELGILQVPNGNYSLIFLSVKLPIIQQAKWGELVKMERKFVCKFKCYDWEIVCLGNILEHKELFCLSLALKISY